MGTEGHGRHPAIDRGGHGGREDRMFVHANVLDAGLAEFFGHDFGQSALARRAGIGAGSVAGGGVDADVAEKPLQKAILVHGVGSVLFLAKIVPIGSPDGFLFGCRFW